MTVGTDTLVAQRYTTAESVTLSGRPLSRSIRLESGTATIPGGQYDDWGVSDFELNVDDAFTHTATSGNRLADLTVVVGSSSSLLVLESR